MAPPGEQYLPVTQERGTVQITPGAETAGAGEGDSAPDRCQEEARERQPAKPAQRERSDRQRSGVRGVRSWRQAAFPVILASDRGKDSYFCSPQEDSTLESRAAPAAVSSPPVIMLHRCAPPAAARLAESRSLSRQMSSQRTAAVYPGFKVLPYTKDLALNHLANSRAKGSQTRAFIFAR